MARIIYLLATIIATQTFCTNTPPITHIITAIAVTHNLIQQEQNPQSPATQQLAPKYLQQSTHTKDQEKPRDLNKSNRNTMRQKSGQFRTVRRYGNRESRK